MLDPEFIARLDRHLDLFKHRPMLTTLVDGTRLTLNDRKKLTKYYEAKILELTASDIDPDLLEVMLGNIRFIISLM